MKTIQKILGIIFLLLFGSGVFAQSCDLRITDNDNTSGAYYSGYIQLWDYSSTPATQLSNEPFYEYYPTSGATVNISLSYQVDPDIARLKFHVHAVNVSTSKSGDAQSAQYFDSGDYNNNHPDVALSIQQ